MALPKPSVCIILVRQLQQRNAGFNYQILLAKRPEKSRSFPGAHVFPGGLIEESDSLKFWKGVTSNSTNSRWTTFFQRYSDEKEYQRRIASIREVFEETNILLASCGASFSHKLLKTEEKQEAGWFANYCVTNGIEPQISSLVPFARWITPESAKVRFDTVFYLAPVLETQLMHAELNPGEIESLDWFMPSEAITAFESGRIKLAPPTLFKLSEMRHCPDYAVLMNPPSDKIPEAVLPVFIPGNGGTESPAIVLPGDKDHPNTIITSSTIQSPLRRMENPFSPEQRFVEYPPNQPLLSNISDAFQKPKL